MFIHKVCVDKGFFFFLYYLRITWVVTKFSFNFYCCGLIFLSTALEKREYQ